MHTAPETDSPAPVTYFPPTLGPLAGSAPALGGTHRGLFFFLLCSNVSSINDCHLVALVLVPWLNDDGVTEVREMCQNPVYGFLFFLSSPVHPS